MENKMKIQLLLLLFLCFTSVSSSSFGMEKQSQSPDKKIIISINDDYQYLNSQLLESKKNSSNLVYQTGIASILNDPNYGEKIQKRFGPLWETQEKIFNSFNSAQEIIEALKKMYKRKEYENAYNISLFCLAKRTLSDIEKAHIYYIQSRIAYKDNQYTLARSKIQKTLSIDDPMLITKAGIRASQLYLLENNYEKAIEACSLSVTEANKTNNKKIFGRALFHLALAHHKQGNFQAAYEVFKKSEQFNYPKATPLLNILKKGQLENVHQLFKEKKYLEALQRLDVFKKDVNDLAAPELRPILQKIHLHTGLFYKRLKNTPKYIDAFEAGSALGSWQCTVNLANHWIANKQFEQAQELLQPLVYHNAHAAYTMGALFEHWKCSNYATKALKWYRKTVKLQPKKDHKIHQLAAARMEKLSKK